MTSYKRHSKKKNKPATFDRQMRIAEKIGRLMEQLWTKGIEYPHGGQNVFLVAINPYGIEIAAIDEEGHAWVRGEDITDKVVGWSPMAFPPNDFFEEKKNN